jgi:hypothetical protein
MSHLTNYSLNKKSEAFVTCRAHGLGGGRGEAGEEGCRGLFEPLREECQAGSSKRTLTYTLKLLAEAGVDTEAVWGKIKQVVERTCLLMKPFLKDAVDELVVQGGGSGGEVDVSAGKEEGGRWLASKVFHLVGFDVMLDSKGGCHLLEINCSPRLGIDGVAVVDKEQPPENPRDICRCIDDPHPHVHYRCPLLPTPFPTPYS